ncbi:MAG: hypothetical protein R6U35_05925 [Candidatus Humimicrobiaceae bacterium]
MKGPRDKVKIKVKTESYIVEGTVHVMAGGRLSDYMTSHVDKFIPITDVHVTPISKKFPEEKRKREVVFINVEKIEMIEYL